VPGWARDFAATGKPAQRGQSIGDYAAVGGSAPIYQRVSEDGSFPQSLRAALAGVRSCTFDLASGDLASGTPTFDLLRADLDEVLRVELDGTLISRDGVNGWRVVSATSLELVGQACENLRFPTASGIRFDVACQ
jgi:hypothetical protein